MILFLDYDGVLHADQVYRTKKGIVLRGSGKLFEHVPILVAMLEPHPDVRIVLSTSWVRELGFTRAKKRLPQELQARVVGATYHSDFDRETYMGKRWRYLTRFEQIARHVTRNGVTNWVAIDNDQFGWPPNLRHLLVLTDDDLGLMEISAQQDLADALMRMEQRRIESRFD